MPNDVKNSESVIYNENEILISPPVNALDSFVVYVRPEDKIKLNFDLKQVKVTFVNGDVDVIFPNGARISISSLAAIYYSDSNVEIFDLNSKKIALEDLLKNYEVLDSNALLILSNKDNYELIDTKEIINRIVLGSDNDGELDGGNPIAGIGQLSTPTTGKVSLTVDKTAFSTLFKQNDSTDPFPVNIYTSDLNGDTDYSNYAAGTRTITQEPILSFTWYFGYDYTSKNETIEGVQYSSYVLKSVRPGTNKDPLTQIDTIVIDASQNVSGSQGASFDYHSDSFDKTLEIGYGKGVKPTDIEIVGLNVQDFGGYSPEEILSIENASTAILRYDPDLQDSSGKPTGGYVVTNLDYDGKISLNLHIPFNMNAKYDLEFNVHYVDPVSGNLVVMSITKTMVIMPVSSQKDLSSADFVLSSSSPGVNFIGTGNDDFVILGAPDNSADGGRGNDYFALNIGDDEIKGSFGNDVVMASSGVDIIYANGDVGASTDHDQILYNNGRFSANYDGQTVSIYDATVTVGLSDDQKKYTGYNTAAGGDNYKTDTNKMTQGINLYYGLEYMGEYINSVAPGVYDGRIPLTDVGSTGVFVQKQQGGDIILTDNSTVLIAGTRYDDVFTIYSELSQSITLIGDGNSSTNSNAGDSLIFSSLSQSPTGGMVDTSGAEATFDFRSHMLTSSKSIVAEVKFGQIEKFAGGNNDDLFIGDNFNLVLDGDDTTNPADVHGYILNGGGGFDTVDYNQVPITGVTVSAVGSDYIRVGKNTSGAYEEDGSNYGIGGATNDIDKMNNVERIVGTTGDDTFLGSSSSKFNITYDGTTSGTDKLSYGLSGGSVTVVLGADFNPSAGGFSGVYIYKYNPTVVDYNYETMVAANPKSDYAENMSTIELTDHEDLIFLELSAMTADADITAEFVNVDQNSILSNRDTVSWYDVDDGTGGAVDTSYYTVDTTLANNEVQISNDDPTSSNVVNIGSIVFDNNGSSTTQAVVKKYVGGVGGTMFYGSKDTNYTFIGNADTNLAPTAKDTLSYENADTTDLDAINFLIGNSGQVTKITVNDGQYVDDYENITVFVGSAGDDKFVYADVDSSGSGQDVVDIIKSYEIDGKGQGTKGDSLEFSKISSTTMNTLVGIHFSTKATNTTENMYFLSSPSDEFGATDIEGIVATVGSDYYVGTVGYVSTFDGGSSFVNVDLKTLTAEDEGKEALTHFSNFLKAYYNNNNSTVLNAGVSDADGDLQGDIMDFGGTAKIEIKLDSSNSNSSGGSYVTENSAAGAEDVTGRNLTYFSNVEIFYALEIEAIMGGGASTIGSYAFIAGNSTDGKGGTVTLLYADTSSNVSSSISVDFLSMTTSRGSNKDTFLANNVNIVGTSTDDTFIIGYSEEAFAEIGVLNFSISGGGGIEILDFSNVEEGFTDTSFVNLVTNNNYEVLDNSSAPQVVAVYTFDSGSVYSYSLTHYADQLVYVATPFDNMNITVDFLDNTQEPQKKDSFSYKDYSSTSNKGVIVTGTVGSTSSVNVSRDGYADNFKNVQELTLTKYTDVLNYSEGMTVEVNADVGVADDSVEDEVNFGNINEKVVITFSNGSDSSIVIGNTSTNVSNLKGFDSYVASSGDTQYIIDSSYDSNTNNLKLTGSLKPGATSSISFTNFTSGINYDMEKKTVAATDSSNAQKNYKIEAIAISKINLSDFNDTVRVGDDGTQTTFDFQGKESTGYDKLDYSAITTDMKFDVMGSYVATENFVQYFTASATDSVDLLVNDKASFEISSFDSSQKFVNNIIINNGVDSEMIFSASTGDATNGFTGVAIFVESGVMKFSDIAKNVSNTNDMVKVTDASGTLQKTDLYLTDYKDIVEIDQSSIGLYNTSFASINGSVSEEFYGSSKDELKLTNFNGAGNNISFDTGTGELSTASGALIVKGFGVVSADLQTGGTAAADIITIIGSYSSYDYDVSGDNLDKVILDYSNLSYVDVSVELLTVVLNTGGSNSDDLSFNDDLKGSVEVKLTNNADNIAVAVELQGDVKFNLGTYTTTSARDSIKFTNISNSTMDMTDIYNDNVSNTASKGMIGTLIFEEDSTATNTTLVFNADGYDPLYDKMVYTVNSRFDNSKISYEDSSNVVGSAITTGILLDVSDSKIYKQVDYADPLIIEAPISATDKYDILQRSGGFAPDGKFVFYDVVGTKNDDYMVGGVSGVRFDGVGDEGSDISNNQYGDVTTYSKNTGFGIEVDLKAISTGVNDGYVEITKFVGGQAVVGSEDYIIQVESLIGTDVDDVFYADETGTINVKYVSGGSGNDVYSYANFTAGKTGQITNVNGFEIIELTTYGDSIEFDNTLIQESFTVKGGGGDDRVSYANMNNAALSLGYQVDGGKSYVKINKSDTASASADVYVDTYEDVKSFDLKNDNIVNTVLDENLITDNISVLVSYNSDGFDSDGNPTTANVYSLLDLSNTTSNFTIKMNIDSSGAYSAGTMGFAIVGAQLEYDRFFGYGSLELSGNGSSVTLAVSDVDTASRSLNTVVDSATYKSSDLLIFKMESNITSFKLDNNAGTFVVNNNGVENFTNFTQYKYLEVTKGTYDIVADTVNSYEYDFSDASNNVSTDVTVLSVTLDYSNLNYSVAAVYDTGSSSLTIAEKVATPSQVPKKSDTIKGVDRVTTIVLTAYDDSFDAAGKYNSNLSVDMGDGYKDSVTFASSTTALDASFAQGQFTAGGGSSNVTIMNNEVYGLTNNGDSVSLEDNTFDTLFIDGLAGDDTIKFASGYFTNGVDSLLFVVSTKNVGTADQYDSLELLGNGTTSSNAEFISFEKINYNGMIVTDKELSYIFKSNTLTITEVDYKGSTMDNVVSSLDFSDTSGSAIIFNITANGGINVGDGTTPSSISFIGILSDKNSTQLTLSSVDDTINIDYNTVLKGDLSIIGDGLGSDKVVFSNQTTVTSMDFVASGVDSVQVSSAAVGFNLSTKGIGEFILDSNTVTEFTFSRENVSSNVKSLTVDLTKSSFAAQNSKLTLDYSQSSQDNLSLTETVASSNTQIVMTDGSSSSVLNDTFLLQNNLAHNVEVILSAGSNNYTQAFGSTQSSIVYTVDFNDAVSGAGDKLILSDSATSGKVAKISSSSSIFGYVDVNIDNTAGASSTIFTGKGLKIVDITSFGQSIEISSNVFTSSNFLLIDGTSANPSNVDKNIKIETESSGSYAFKKGVNGDWGFHHETTKAGFDLSTYNSKDVYFIIESSFDTIHQSYASAADVASSPVLDVSNSAANGNIQLDLNFKVNDLFLLNGVFVDGGYLIKNNNGSTNVDIDINIKGGVTNTVTYYSGENINLLNNGNVADPASIELVGGSSSDKFSLVYDYSNGVKNTKIKFNNVDEINSIVGFDNFAATDAVIGVVIYKENSYYNADTITEVDSITFEDFVAGDSIIVDMSGAQGFVSVNELGGTSKSMNITGASNNSQVTTISFGDSSDKIVFSDVLFSDLDVSMGADQVTDDVDELVITNYTGVIGASETVIVTGNINGGFDLSSGGGKVIAVEKIAIGGVTADVLNFEVKGGVDQANIFNLDAGGIADVDLTAVSFSNTILSLTSQGSSFNGFDSSGNKIANVSNVSSIQIRGSTKLEINAGSNFDSFKTISFYSGDGEVKILTSAGALDIDVTGSGVNKLHVNTIGTTSIGSEYFNVINFETVDLTKSNVGSNNIDVTTTVLTSLTYIMNPQDSINFASGSLGNYSVNEGFEVNRAGVATDHVIGTNIIGFTVTKDEKGNSFSDEVIFGFEGTYESYLQDREEMLNEKGEFDVELGVSDDELTMDYLVDGEIDTGMGVDDIYLNFEIDSNILFKVEGNDLILIDQENGVETVFENSVNDNIFDNEGNLIASNGELLNSQYQENNIGNTNGDSSYNMIFNDFTTSDYYSYYYGSEYNDITSGETSLITENTVENVEEEKDDEKINMQDIMNYLENNDNSIDDLLSNMQDILENTEVDINVSFDFINEKFEEDNSYIFHTTNKEEEKDSNKQMHVEIMKNFSNMSGGQSY